MQAILLITLCFVPILLIPLFVGIGFFTGRGKTDLHLMAAILTLKPVFLTPVWFSIMTVFEISHPTFGKVLGILPAVVVTVLVIIKFRSLLFGYEIRQAAWLLIVLDVVRWTSTLYLSFSTGGTLNFSSFVSISAPTIFAFVALGVVAREDARPPRKQKRDEV